jgi:hypothetical protein
MATHQLDEYLGTGVDIISINPWEIPNFKTRMIDDPTTEETPIARSGYREKYSDSLLKLSQELCVEAGLKGAYAGVTASVKTKFKQSTQSTEKSHFLRISFTNSGTRLVIEGNNKQVRAQLNDEFKTALDSGDPDELIKEYGTHLVRKIIVGGRAEYFVRSKETSKLTSEEFEVAAKAKYASLGGDTTESVTGSVGVSSSVNMKNTAKIKDLVGSESIDTVGGSAEKSIGIKTKSDWDAWAQSVATTPGFLGFEQDGLMPIWELTSDKARSKVIYEAYKRRAAKEFTPEILTVTSEPGSHPDMRIVVPEGFKLLGGGALDNWKGYGNLLTASFPESDNTWRGSGKDHSAADPASISAFALAVYDPDDIWEVKIFQSRPSPTSAHPEQEVAVEPGYVMVGGGAWVDWAGEGNMLFASHPTPENKAAWHAQSKDHLKSSPAKITAYAVGLKCKVEGVKVHSAIAIARSNKSNRPQAAAAPPAGYKMVGGGAALTFDKGGMLLTASYPNENNQWEGRGKDHLEADGGIMTAYCIGLKVEVSAQG